MTKPGIKKPATVISKNRKITEKNPGLQWFKSLLPLLVILPLVFIAFSPVLHNELTNWDDSELITDNPLIRNFTWEGIKNIFSQFYFGNYQPLHLVSYTIEYHFWQLNPKGYHAVSLVMFLTITALVYRFIYLISNRDVKIATMGTLLFGLNGMRVESVAWAAERKDMLYTLFYVAALIMYVHYIIHNQQKRKFSFHFYLFSFIFFILSVFSKVMAVSLVGALVFLDFLFSRKISWWLVMEKIPFILLSVIMGLVQISATASTRSIDTTGQFGLFDRLLIVGRNLMFFIYKMIIPLNLSAFHPYPRWHQGQAWPAEFYAGLIFSAALLLIFIWSVKKAKIVAFTIGFFFSSLALVLQFVAIGPSLFNERYSLIPAVALSFFIAYYIVQIITKYPGLKYILYVITGLYLVIMMIITYQRCEVWRTSIRLWDNVLEQYPGTAMALNNRGRIYGSELGNTTKALEDLSLAIVNDPKHERAYSNRGIVYCMNGKFDLAIADFNRAIKLRDDFYEPRVNRAIAYAQSNRPDSALTDFSRCLLMKPGDPSVYYNRGLCWFQLKQYEKALSDFNEAIRSEPGKGELYLRRSYAYSNLGKYTEAYRDILTAQNSGLNPEPDYLKFLKSRVEKPSP